MSLPSYYPLHDKNKILNYWFKNGEIIMKFVCANANLIQGVNLDTDYDYITARAKSHVLAIETLANSFAKSKSDCVFFVCDTDDPYDLVRATEQASLENINFKEVIDDLKHYIDFSVLGDFDFRTFELDGYTISVVKYVTMNNLKESARKSTKESIKESSFSFVSVSDFCKHCASNMPCQIWSVDGHHKYDEVSNLNKVQKSSYKYHEVMMWDIQYGTIILYIENDALAF